MFKKISLLIAGFAVIAIVGGGCTSQDAKIQTDELSKVEETGEVSQLNLTQEVKEFSIIAKNWEFEPSEIKVKKGDKVKLTIKSIDVEHGFSIPDFNVSKKLIPDETEVIEFTADKTGTFTFFCNVWCGAGHSTMSGKLIVE